MAYSVNPYCSGIFTADSDSNNETERILADLIISFVLLCVILCDPLWLMNSFLSQRDTKVITKVHKGFINSLVVVFYEIFERLFKNILEIVFCMHSKPEQIFICRKILVPPWWQIDYCSEFLW